MSTTEEIARPLLSVRVEVWPVAADESGIWLVSPEGDAWQSDVIEADTEPHRAVNDLLRTKPGYRNAAGGALDAVQLLHSTSWRADRDAVVLTYVAVLGGHGSHAFVREAWPEARPLGPQLTDSVGKPFPHGAIEPPTPRYIDVLLHAIRHLRFLLDTDVSAQAALDEHWRQYLRQLQPALAGMYR